MHSDVVHESSLGEPYPRTEIDNTIPLGRSISIPEPRLACSEAPFHHSPIPLILISHSQQSPQRRREGERHIALRVIGLHIIDAGFYSEAAGRLDHETCLKTHQAGVCRGELADRK